VSILPFDVLAVALNSDKLKKMTALRIVRLFRLFKLLRILRAGRMFARWETAVAVNYSLLTLVQFFIMTIVVAHWMACAWHMIVVIEDDPENNWVVGYLGSDHGLRHGEVYIVSIYWSVMTMSTIGYGDVVAKTSLERFFGIFGMFIGSATFAYVVGSVTGTVASMNMRQTEFYELMDAVNGYMIEVELPNKIRMRIREYFRHRFNTGSLHSNADLLNQMSPALRENVATHTHSSWIRDIPFFMECNDEFVVKVALLLEQRTYAPHELVISLMEDAETLYIVKSGVCACKGMIYTSGKYFGEDMITAIVKPAEAKRFYMARALTFSDVYTLTKTNLMTLLEHERFKAVFAHIQKLACKNIFRECILSYNNAVQNLMSGDRKFSGNRQLVEQFQAKLSRLLPTEDEMNLPEEEEEEGIDDANLGNEGKIISSELQKMTAGLEAMRERVAKLEKTFGKGGGMSDRVATLDVQLQQAGRVLAGLGGDAQPAELAEEEEEEEEPMQDPSAEWGAPASASFASPKKH